MRGWIKLAVMVGVFTALLWVSGTAQWATAYIGQTYSKLTGYNSISDPSLTDSEWTAWDNSPINKFFGGIPNGIDHERARREMKEVREKYYSKPATP